MAFGTRKVRIGLDGKLYRNSGTFGSPSWVVLEKVNDLALTLEMNEVDASDRSSVWEMVEKGLGKATVTFDYGYHEDDATNWQLLLTTFLDRDTPLEFAVMDGPIDTSGEIGWRITAHVMKASEKQDKEGRLMLDVELKPAPNADGNPQQITVA